jgi:hypothetical protein
MHNILKTGQNPFFYWLLYSVFYLLNQNAPIYGTLYKARPDK